MRIEVNGIKISVRDRRKGEPSLVLFIIGEAPPRHGPRSSIAGDHILTAMPVTNAQKEWVIEDNLRGGAAAKDA